MSCTFICTVQYKKKIVLIIYVLFCSTNINMLKTRHICLRNKIAHDLFVFKEYKNLELFILLTLFAFFHLNINLSIYC